MFNQLKFLKAGKRMLVVFLLLLSLSVQGQNIGIGTNAPHASSKLEISSTTSGTLITRMTTAQRNAIANPAVGLLVYDTEKFTIYMYNGHQWLPLIFGSGAILPGLAVSPSNTSAASYIGYTVAIHGDFAIVGAPADTIGANGGQGSAFIFYKSSNGWIQQAKLSASDGAAGDGFGLSVDISGNYAVVGAYADTIGTNLHQGSAYIFFNNGSNWVQQAKLTASDGGASDFFGTTVSISGDYVLIGAYQDDAGVNVDQGSAYIFYRGSGWTTGQAHQTKLLAIDGAAFDEFGIGVSINGDYAIVGASHGLSTDKGSAYIYGRIGTSWIFLAELTASDGVTGDFFGYSVDINNEYAVVGAMCDGVNGNFRQGSVYIFNKGSNWTTGQPHQAKLTAIDGSPEDQFGVRVGISGDHVIVGAFFDDVGPYGNQGSSYLYKKNGAIWNLVRKIDDVNGQSNGVFGVGVGISGYNVVIGAYGKNYNQGEVMFLNFQ